MTQLRPIKYRRKLSGASKGAPAPGQTQIRHPPPSALCSALLHACNVGTVSGGWGWGIADYGPPSSNRTLRMAEEGAGARSLGVILEPPALDCPTPDSLLCEKY